MVGPDCSLTIVGTQRAILLPTWCAEMESSGSKASRTSFVWASARCSCFSDSSWRVGERRAAFSLYPRRVHSQHMGGIGQRRLGCLVCAPDYLWEPANTQVPLACLCSLNIQYTYMYKDQVQHSGRVGQARTRRYMVSKRWKLGRTSPVATGVRVSGR